MANISQKTRLLKILKKLGGDAKIEGDILEEMIEEIEQIRRSIPKEPDLSPYFREVKSLENKHTSLSAALSHISDKLFESRKQLTEEIKKADGKFISLSEEIFKILDDLRKDLENINKEVLKPRSQGGGNKQTTFYNNGTLLNSRYADINLIPGTGVTFTIANDNTNKWTNVTVNATGGGGSTSFETPTGTIDGANTSFTVTHTPIFIVVDRIFKFSQLSDYSYVGGTITILDGAPPVQTILSAF